MPFLQDRKNYVPRSRQLEDRAKKHGLRHAIYNTVHDSYKGEWKNNQKCGKGVIRTRFHDLYEGDMERNYRHGFGILSTMQESKVYTLVYTGKWKNGKMCGSGFKAYKNNSFYVGNFKNNKREGFGRMWYNDNSFYEGYWEEDKRHGEGLWVRPDGNRYEGEWVDDIRQGEGRFFHLQIGQMQEGVWKDDVCVFSTLINIPYRQCARKPTTFPLLPANLCDREIEKFKEAALDDEIEPCLSSEDTKISSTLSEEIIAENL